LDAEFFVITPKNCTRPLKVLGEHDAAWHLAKLHKFTPLRHETAVMTFSSQNNRKHCFLMASPK
jgi:hypothetical protein